MKREARDDSRWVHFYKTARVGSAVAAPLCKFCLARW